MRLRLGTDHVVALQFVELGDDHDLMRNAQRRNNLIVYGPETAVIRGIRGPWLLSEPVGEQTKDLLDIPFDSDAVPDRDQVLTQWSIWSRRLFPLGEVPRCDRRRR